MRLIDADTLLHAIATQTINNGKTDDMKKAVFATLEYCRQMIEMQPTIKSDSVQHGHWIEAIPDADLIRCSVCDGGTIAPRLWNGHKLPLDKYCRFCGARMDGDPDA